MFFFIFGLNINTDNIFDVLASIIHNGYRGFVSVKRHIFNFNFPEFSDLFSEWDPAIWNQRKILEKTNLISCTIRTEIRFRKSQFSVKARVKKKR